MTELLPLLLAAVLVYFVWRAIRPSTSGKPQAARAVAPALTWPALGEYEFEVVGESHYQRALKALAGDHGDDAADVQTTAVLVPYDSNPYDDKAVKVLIDGHEVGHLSRDDARGYRRRLAAKKQGMVPAQCGALIMGGFIGRDGERASYGVRLDMKPFE